MRSFAQPVERRKFGRRQTYMHARISARGRPSVPCIIRDVSDSGALLEVSYPQWLPSRFHLLVEGNGFETDCEIVHRTDDAVGVRFTEPSALKF